MRREAALVLAAGALALSGCQTTGANVEYVKYRKGPELETAKAECKAYAAKASHLVIGIGGPEAIIIGAIATAAATAARRVHVFEQCMVAQGYQKVDARTAGRPTAAPAAPPPKAAKKPPMRAG